MKNADKKIENFLTEIEDMVSSLKESVKDATSVTEKWNAVDKFMMDMERMADSQPITSKKSFRGLENGKDVEGNTRYLTHLSPMPIMINSIENEDGSLSPSEVSEMHIGNIDGKKCLLITPIQISLNL